jgi:signal transduction histidine kinase
MWGDEIVGFLELHNKLAPPGFSSLDLELLITIAQIAANSLSNALAFQRLAQASAEREMQVAERTAQLRETNEELDSFASSVSHDLRAPLRAIQVYAEILLEPQKQHVEPDRIEYLRRIQRAAHRMDRFIDDLLQFSRLSRRDLSLAPVSLKDVVQQALEELKLDPEAKAFELKLPDDLPEVRGDRTILVQVLLNLLSNAIKYVPPGATPRLRIWVEQGPALIRLYLEDNGIGIAQQDQERIFRPFERLHGEETYQGTGMGVAFARKGVLRLGGSLGVVSSPGEGSRFWFELPAITDHEHPASSPEG